MKLSLEKLLFEYFFSYVARGHQGNVGSKGSDDGLSATFCLLTNTNEKVKELEVPVITVEHLD